MEKLETAWQSSVFDGQLDLIFNYMGFFRIILICFSVLVKPILHAVNLQRDKNKCIDTLRQKDIETKRQKDIETQR